MASVAVMWRSVPAHTLKSVPADFSTNDTCLLGGLGGGHRVAFPAHHAGLRRYIIERSQARISAFLNISYIGLVAWDYELTNIELPDVALFEMVANRRERRHLVRSGLSNGTAAAQTLVYAPSASWWRRDIRQNRCAVEALSRLGRPREASSL